MMSCRRVHELISHDAISSCSIWMRLRLRLHLVLCRLCRRGERQLRIVDAGMRGIEEEAAADEGERLTEEARERIHRAMRDL